MEEDEDFRKRPESIASHQGNKMKIHYLLLANWIAFQPIEFQSHHVTYKDRNISSLYSARKILDVKSTLSESHSTKISSIDLLIAGGIARLIVRKKERLKSVTKIICTIKPAINDPLAQYVCTKFVGTPYPNGHFKVPLMCRHTYHENVFSIFVLL